MTAVNSRTLRRLMEENPLVAALVLSLLIHVGVYGSWRMGKELGWWKYQPTWLTNWTRKLAKPTAAKARQRDNPQNVTIPMTFVEVDPDTVVAEAPKDAKYYSSKNAKASNPDPKDELIPKVDGKQEQVVRTMDVEKPKPFPLQPATPRPPKPEDFLEPKPKSDVPGDLALTRTKPNDGKNETGKGETQDPPRERPRTLAAAREQKGILSGQKMRQEGGASNRGKVAFDTKSTPFGEYDAAFIAAVEQCWHNLLDEHQGTQRAGKVVVDFRLTYDGRITDVRIQEDNQVGEVLSMLCQNAILNPQPYPRWPAQMRQTIGGNSREIRFTFYYN